MAAVKKSTNALPDFITLSGNILTITPLDHTDIGTWIITATMTTANGVDPTWDAATITVGCTVTGITAAAPPASPAVTLTYNLYAAPLLIDLTTWAYTQAPSCGYTFTQAFTWTIPAAASSYIQQSTPVPKAITIQASRKAAVGTHAVVMTNTITDNN
jgi:hypothetical protein